MAYLSMMIVVWNVMNVLAEIVTFLPMKGITIPYFVKRFVDPSLAFAAGWNYWYAYSILVAAEASGKSGCSLVEIMLLTIWFQRAVFC
jgi:yeast amino acid transporter